MEKHVARKQNPPPGESCPRCFKPLPLCICGVLKPVKTEAHILILQHPQEPDKELGSAQMAHLQLPNSTLKIGLSWPNLKAALGREAQSGRWAVLYLGSGVKASAPDAPKHLREALQFVSKKGTALPRPKDPIEGVVILDGTWSQAKALWWRNAWLLKLKRVVLTPKHPSLYKELRKEPRRDCLSTIESIAEIADALGESAEVGQQLRESFTALLDLKRASRKRPPRGT